MDAANADRDRPKTVQSTLKSQQDVSIYRPNTIVLSEMFICPQLERLEITAPQGSGGLVPLDVNVLKQ
jgi:hypothetical protein